MAIDSFIWFAAPASGGLLISGATQPKGETADKWFAPKGAFEIEEVSFSVENPTTVGSATGGSGAGKAKFNPFHIRKDVDAASCPLFSACVAGAHFPSMMLAVRKSGGVNLVYLQYIFRQVFVTEITWVGGGGDDNPKEEITFVYGALGIQYIQQKPDGSAGTALQGMWSQITNKTTMDVPGATGAAPTFLTGADAQQA
jgi:type VI secretion system secreted protein Hcp